MKRVKNNTKMKCEKCGYEIDLDKTEKDLRIISEHPKLGEVFVTCCHCNHEQRIAVFDQDTAELVMKRKKLQQRIEIAGRGLAFRKGAFRKKTYLKMIKEDDDLKDQITTRMSNLTTVIDNARKVR